MSIEMTDDRHNKTIQHLLSFVTNTEGSYLAIHLDLEGARYLRDEIDCIIEKLEEDDCPHTHLFPPPFGELTTTKLQDQQGESNTVAEVKIYGWNEEWAKRHGLK